ncbi:16S rRNA (cytosine967-C5)-methyltransferase [Noviherbaspirillum humi]|uniref:16S rRNA (Cytosine967-C5)-methyltransferase n=1 Tax=Noviherbaspirillum humi TaxID=1688639 RepID=A0A239CAR1_9BURK|nr:16S rRNA (cytosine(967)-C(5))-methyltransferase RsmB [Noviherbaspirillum humi]SNS16778.1 16S rRNA (cytosine967-C5)-methyltransferase [Noviherbaspirillum humi]
MSRTRLKNDSLAFALQGAARALASVREGAALPQALAGVFAATAAPPPSRGAIQDIAYRALRRLGLSQALLDRLTTRAPSPPLLHVLLCCALALLAQPDEDGSFPYEAFTVVDQTVEAASSSLETAHGKGMVNAVLRRFLRERQALLEAVLKQESARWNYPDWWITETRQAYPDRWQAILEAGNRMPPLTLRVNRRRTDVDAYLQRLREHGLQGERIGASAVRMVQALPVSQLPGFDAGLVSVQDAAAQQAAPLLDVRDGMRVLDACAAPGGKTGHLLELADIDLTALDSDPARLEKVRQNLGRLELSAKLASGDAAARNWWDGKPFQRILADVPCTASGIVRRHPDIRWLRRKSDAVRLAALSGRILDNLWQLLEPGGKLLFATCSIWPHESERQAAAFAARHDARRLDAPGQMLPTAALEQDHDGLFYALFQK